MTDPARSIDFEALRADEALLVQVVESYVTPGRTLVRTGLRYRVSGPGDDASSVTLYVRDDGAWKFHRFSTGEDGDVLDVLKWYAGATRVADAAQMIGALPPVPERIQRRLSRPEDRPTPPRWSTDPTYADGLVAAYANHPAARAAWTRYKPLLASTIAGAQLGYGVLPRHEVIRDDGTRAMVHPARCNHERLIYPVRFGGVVVALRGRHAGCPCDPKRTKWLSAGGSKAHLYNLERVVRGTRVVVCENPIDALVAGQIESEQVTVAPTAGAGTWKPEWSAALAARRPGRVLVWFDHDLSGNCRPDHCASCRDELGAWRARHPSAVRPPAGGPRVAQALKAEGLTDVHLYQWRPTDAPGADLGDVLAAHVERIRPVDRTTAQR